MNGKPPPLVPASLPMARALERSEPLTRLRQRLLDSARRLAAIHQELPEPLRSQVTAGPVDDEGWTLLAANASVAAKLRHLQPRLQQTLCDRGWQVSAIRIRIQPR